MGKRHKIENVNAEVKSALLINSRVPVLALMTMYLHLFIYKVGMISLRELLEVVYKIIECLSCLGCFFRYLEYKYEQNQT